ncbi:MAG: hypothetical protein K5896_04115 [Prevotella sp.]|nr:hypothetical protein [Prevotella sp.]
MKKNLLMMAAVMFGILIAFASCKDKKTSKVADDDDEDETEQVEKKGSKKDVALKKVASLEDIETLAEYDLDDIDISDLSMDDIDFNNVDLDNLTEDQANALLDLVVIVGGNELPQEAGGGVTIESIDKDDDSVSFVLEMSKEALSGVTMEQFNQVLNMPELKEMMMQEMIKSLKGNNDFNKFVQVVLVAKKDMVFKFVDKETGDSADLTLSAAELRRIQNQ